MLGVRFGGHVLIEWKDGECGDEARRMGCSELGDHCAAYQGHITSKVNVIVDS